MNIKIQNVTKKYNSKLILDNISLQINGGNCYCLLGKNGSGKSTLIHMIINLIDYDKGTIKINEKTNNPISIETKKIIGTQLNDDLLINELTGYEYLLFVGMSYKIKQKELKKRINSLISFFFANENIKNKRISILSTGMKRKLSICVAFINKPKILILDEPFAGLDSISSLNLVNLINNYKSDERIIIISSHNMNYIQKVSTHIGVLDNSKLLFNGTLNNFQKNSNNYLDDELIKLLNIKEQSINKLSWLK